MSKYIITNHSSQLFYHFSHPTVLYLWSYFMPTTALQGAVCQPWVPTTSCSRGRWRAKSLWLRSLLPFFKGRVRSLGFFPSHFVADARECNYTVLGNTFCRPLSEMICWAEPNESWVWYSLEIFLPFLYRTQWRIPFMVLVSFCRATLNQFRIQR